MRPSSGRRSASSAAPAAAALTFAAHCSEAARCRGRGRRTSSSAAPRSRAPSSSGRWLPPPEPRLSVLDRGRHAVAYAKGLDAIELVLTAAGAGDTVLALEERSIVAAARAEANRLANADHANLVRTSRAAQRQLAAVRELQRAGVLQRLPDRLSEVARLRLRHPTLSLRELADRCDPPASKASVHRRCCASSRILPWHERRAGGGSSEDDLPLRGTALGCRRQTGSESAAG